MPSREVSSALSRPLSLCSSGHMRYLGGSLSMKEGPQAGWDSLVLIVTCQEVSQWLSQALV